MGKIINLDIENPNWMSKVVNLEEEQISKQDKAYFQSEISKQSPGGFSTEKQTVSELENTIREGADVEENKEPYYYKSDLISWDSIYEFIDKQLEDEI